MSNLVEKVECKVLSRDWMIRQHSWRVTVEVVDPDGILAATLTHMIEWRVCFTLWDMKDDIRIKIDPAYIRDVCYKGKKWRLVVDTIMESQKDVGPKVTMLVGQPAWFSLTEAEQSGPDEPEINPFSPKDSGDEFIDADQIKKLHTSFFKMPVFREFIQTKVSFEVCDEHDAKKATKEYLGVSSTTHIGKKQLAGLATAFNTWAREKRNAH